MDYQDAPTLNISLEDRLRNETFLRKVVQRSDRGVKKKVKSLKKAGYTEEEIDLIFDSCDPPSLRGRRLRETVASAHQQEAEHNSWRGVFHAVLYRNFRNSGIKHFGKRTQDENARKARTK